MAQHDFTDLIDLAAERVGGAVVYANDEFFAGKENLLKSKPAVFLEGEYTDRGKWMDGWETRRRRTPGSDFCLVRLGLPGRVCGVVIDTAFFRGNYPEHASLDACVASPDASPDALLDASNSWVEIVPTSALRGDAKNLFAVEAPSRFTHLRLNIFPDGGVARLRVHGAVVPSFRELSREGAEIDVAAADTGARVVSCSDMFFGVRHNLISPGRAANMGDGWETKRRRGLFTAESQATEPPSGALFDYPHHDWALVELCAPSVVRRVEVDTLHFKGNCPESCMLDGALVAAGDDPLGASIAWAPLVPRGRLQPSTRHFYEDELTAHGPFTHVRLSIYPDGGVSRLRILGVPTPMGLAHKRFEQLNTAVREEAFAALLACCGSRTWAGAMTARRPFAHRAALFDAEATVSAELASADWLEAFRAHPRVGERHAAAQVSATAAAWSQGEQSGTATATAETMSALAEGNRAYEARFGHVFLVCATGKNAAEMLTSLRQRISNEPAAELAVAAAEQRKITRLRLAKLVGS